MKSKEIVNRPADQLVHILSQADFAKLHQQKSRDFKNSPTPAITVLGEVGQGVGIQFVAIDESFLPQVEKADKYLDCLLEHEFSEAEFMLGDMDKFFQALQDSKEGKPISPEAHLYALAKEMEKAKELGILEEYAAYWNKWMDNKLAGITDEKSRASLLERSGWRNRAVKEAEREIQESAGEALKNNLELKFK